MIKLRGHLGVPDIVSEPVIVPLNYLVILHLIHLKKLSASTGIGIVHLGPPDIPLGQFITKIILLASVPNNLHYTFLMCSKFLSTGRKENHVMKHCYWIWVHI